MSYHWKGGGITSTIISNNSVNNRIEGSGSIVNNNSAVNLLFSTQQHITPSAIIEQALGKHRVPEALLECQTEAGCMPGTRVRFLSDVIGILKTRAGPRIAWIAGMAGTGKSSIALTLCQQLQAVDYVFLGGTFFCSRSAGFIERTDVRRIIPTLAVALARQIPRYSLILAQQLDAEPDIAHRPVRTQVKYLLMHPLEMLSPFDQQIVFVIDALDECHDQGRISELLDSLADFSEDAPVKFLLTSRPEMHIRGSPINDPSLSSILHLHTIDPTEVMEDIRLYISASLERLSPSISWYTANEVDSLVQLSAGLFIFAATVLKYIGDRGTVTGRQERLRKATSAAKTSHAAIDPVDRIYEFVITEASRSNTVDDDELLSTRRALAGILMIRTPVSVDTLANLMNVEPDGLRDCLDRLHSVVYLPSDNETLGVRTLHSSFGDYLFDRATSDLRIARSLGEESLARGCLQVMSKHLRFNVGQSVSSHQPNPLSRPQGVTYYLEYACLQWTYHIANLPIPSVLDEIVAQVFRPGFLFWLEILSRLGHVRRAAAMLILAAATVRDAELSRFLQDANIFVASSHEVIEKSAPHIYLSAIPFATRDSLVYQDFFKQCVGVISVQPFGINRHRGRLVMVLTGHEGPIESIAHSPDGHLLVSGSGDGSMRIWDLRTGEQVALPLQKNVDLIHSVSFASNGRRFAFGTASGLVHIWDVLARAEALSPLTGHSAAVLSVVFSPDDKLIASASTDRTVRLWSTTTGVVYMVLLGHELCVRTIAFSPDGEILASGSDDKTARLWYVATGILAVQKLSVDHMGISSLCFSPDSAILAASSYDGNAQLWAWRTGRNVITLSGHLYSVNCIRFSPDGSSIVSVSSDMTVRLWDLRNGHLNVPSVVLGRHSGAINVVSYSPQGLYIATASDDATIRMWYAGDSYTELEPLPAHTAGIGSVAVISDGTLIVSGSKDRTVRVWNAQTGEQMLEPLLGHEGEVNSVAISWDRRLIVSGSADRSVRLWDAHTGKEVGAPLRFKHEMTQVSFSPDSKLAASGSMDGTVSMWAVTNWLPLPFSPLRCASRLPEQENPSDCPLDVFAVVFSSNQEHVATGTFEACIQLWHTETGQPADPPLRPDVGVILDQQLESEQRKVVAELPEQKLRVAFSLLTGPELRACFSPSAEARVRGTTDWRPGKRGFVIAQIQLMLNKLTNAEVCGVIAQLTGEDLRAVVSMLPVLQAWTALGQPPKTDLRVVIRQSTESTLRSALHLIPGIDLRNVIGRLPESQLNKFISNLPEWRIGQFLSKLPTSRLSEVLSTLAVPNLGGVLSALPAAKLCDLFSSMSEQRMGEFLSKMPMSSMGEFMSELPVSVLCDALGSLPSSRLGTFLNGIPEWRLVDFLSKLPTPRLCDLLRDLTASKLGNLLRAMPESRLSDFISAVPESRLGDFIRARPEPKLLDAINELPESKLCMIIWYLSDSKLGRLINALPESRLGDIISAVPDSRLGDALSAVPRSELARILNLVPTHRMHDMLGELPESEMHMFVDSLSAFNMRAVVQQLSQSSMRVFTRRLPQLEPGDIPLSWRESTKSVAFSPDSMKIVSGVENGTIYVWDVNARSQILALRGHSGSVDAIAWSPDGKIIASGSADNTVRLWNAEKGQPLSTLHGHTQPVRSVAFMPDSRSLISGSDDGSIRIWNVDVSISLEEDNPFRALSCARRDKGWLVGPSGELLQ